MMKLETTKDIGDYGEKIAVRYLRLHGYTVKERNWRTGHMEIDIIAASLSTLAFVEVKTRTYTKESIHDAPPPCMAVDTKKQKLTRAAAREYLYTHRTQLSPRMDVLEVFLIKENGRAKPRVAKIHYIKGAY